MGINKVSFNGTPLIDLTDSTVTPNGVEAGAVFYDSAGERQTGTGMDANTFQGNSIIPISLGGTGSSTADNARTALGAAPLSHTHVLKDIVGQGINTRVISGISQLVAAGFTFAGSKPTCQELLNFFTFNSSNLANEPSAAIFMENAASFSDPPSQTGTIFYIYQSSLRQRLFWLNKEYSIMTAVLSQNDAGNGMNIDSWVYLLTTKNAVTVAYGGTGATDAATARSNLGITWKNITQSTRANTDLDNVDDGVYSVNCTSTVNPSLRTAFGGTSGTYYAIVTQFSDTNGYKVQFAYRYGSGNDHVYRCYYNSAWREWTKPSANTSVIKQIKSGTIKATSSGASVSWTVTDASKVEIRFLGSTVATDYASAATVTGTSFSAKFTGTGTCSYQFIEWA